MAAPMPAGESSGGYGRVQRMPRHDKPGSNTRVVPRAAVPDGEADSWRKRRGKGAGSDSTPRQQLRAPPSKVRPAAADFYMPSLPLLDEKNEHVELASGYLPARAPKPGQTDPADDAHLYFVLERARHLGRRRRLVVWLNGGPGCSSFDGLMMEIGAFRPDTKGGLEWTIAGGAWNEYADVLYLDQPVGTGFSYVSTSGYTRSLEQAADEVVYFLQGLVEVYPEYAKGNHADVYIAGESFAGQYIPFIASALLKTGTRMPVDLRGVAIGNGYIDPKAQAGTELEMMVESKVWDTSREEYKTIKGQVDKCREEVAKDTDNLRKIDACEHILQNILAQTKAQAGGRDMCINVYDVRLSDTYPACGMNWPTTLQATYDYLARPDVREALHVDSRQKPEAWVECNHRVGTPLDNDVHGKASVIKLPEVLDAGVAVLLFAGDKDLICNHIGVERVAEGLTWGGSGWGNPEKKQWFVNGSQAGYWRTNRGLTYVSVADASHMVGVDKPIEAHDMMLRFMGVDLLAAAGPSARITSHIEGEADRKTLIGGGGGALKDDRPMIPGVDGKTEEQVAEEAKWAAYYNAGSAALIVLLILVGTGIWVLLRLRRRSRRQFRRGDGAYIARANGGDGDDHDHELDRFIPDDDGEAGREGLARGRPGSVEGTESSTHSYDSQRERLETATALNTRANGRRADGQTAYRDTDDGENDDENDGIAQRDTAQIFDVGDDDSDDEDGLPKRTPKDDAAQGDGVVRFADAAR